MVHQPALRFTDASSVAPGDLTTPLHAVTFVIVDLETTGGSARSSAITEVGAVKVRGGERLGELATLVNPGQPIPAQISALTGITPGMLADRPPIDAVLPAFLEFARGAALVAHNARFDVGFLDANLARLGYPRLDHPVVCTAALARRLVRDEVRDCRLATLARHLRCPTAPIHRALADARATVEVLHALLERAGSFGVLTLEDLLDFARVRNTPLFKARRGLADGLPHAPGVYAFRDARGEVLYIGKATDLRVRVRSYFGNDDRRSVVAMLRETAALEHWVCPTPIEAAVREVRLIATHRPRFNRRGKTPQRGVYLALTAERFPRLSIVTKTPATAALGPLPSRGAATAVADALHQALPVRRCTTRIGASPVPPCALAELGKCVAPCDGRLGPDEYAAVADAVAETMTGDPGPVLDRLYARMVALGRAGRYDEACTLRERMHALVSAISRTRHLAAAAAPALLVASRPAGRSAEQRRERTEERELVVLRHGCLVATRRCAAADAAAAAAELAAIHGEGLGTSLPHAGGCVRREEAAELALVAAWLDGAGAVVHRCDGELALPLAGGARLAALTRRLNAARSSTGRPAAELAAKRGRRPVVSAR